jgi:hypothetical protein
MPRENEPGVGKADGGRTGKASWTKYTKKAADTSVSWDEVEPGHLGALVHAVTRAGDAVLFGKSRDGGTLVITICAGDERIKFYASSREQAESLLLELIHSAES